MDKQIAELTAAIKEVGEKSASRAAKRDRLRWTPDSKAVREFETSLAEYVGLPYCVATITGTAALHAALLASVYHEIDRPVVMPAISYIATANAVAYCGMQPVLVDVEPDGQASASQVINGINAFQPQAVIIPHLYGHAVTTDLHEIAKVCREKRIPLIEDASQALGVLIGNEDGTRMRHAGTTGDVMTLSFAANKIITCGQGGAVLTRYKAVADRVRLLCRMATQTEDNGRGVRYDEVGYNYRMSGAAAGLASASLSKVSIRIKSRLLRRAELIESIRKSVKWPVHIIEPRDRTKPNGWMLPIDMGTLERRNALQEVLLQEGVECRRMWPPMNHALPFRRNVISSPLPMASQVGASVLLIPCE